jgi:hypothetical protein
LGRISSYELGFSPGVYSLSIKRDFEKSFLFLVGSDFLSFNFSSSYIVYQGSFDFANDFFIIFPTSIFVEKFSYFLNLEGRLRKSFNQLPLFFLFLVIMKFFVHFFI